MGALLPSATEFMTKRTRSHARRPEVHAPQAVTPRDILGFCTALANVVAALAKHANTLGKVWKWIENLLP